MSTSEDKKRSESFRRRNRVEKFQNLCKDRGIKDEGTEKGRDSTDQSRQKQILFPGFDEGMRKRGIQ